MTAKQLAQELAKLPLEFQEAKVYFITCQGYKEVKYVGKIKRPDDTEDVNCHEPQIVLNEPRGWFESLLST